MHDTYKIAILDQNSLPDIQEIILTRKKMGVHHITIEQALKTYEKISSVILRPEPDNETYIWGAFRNNMISAFMVQSFSKKCKEDWLMAYLAVNTKIKKPWNYSKNGMDELWAESINYAESKGSHVIRWSVPAKWANTQQRTQVSSSVWKKYTIYTYCQVPTGTTPEHKLDQWVAGNVKPYDVVLKKAIISNY